MSSGGSLTASERYAASTHCSIARCAASRPIAALPASMSAASNSPSTPWPYLHVSMPGSWNLTAAQTLKLREYLLRDGRAQRRVMVAMAFNSGLGDSWQLAGEPRYPEKSSALGLGLRIGVKYNTPMP